MPFLYSLRFKSQFEGEDGLLAMFNLYENSSTSLILTHTESFFRITVLFCSFLVLKDKPQFEYDAVQYLMRFLRHQIGNGVT